MTEIEQLQILKSVMLEQSERFQLLKHVYGLSLPDRLHERNGDQPYASCLDSISKWPETATSIAVRLTPASDLEFLAPFGLGDIFQLIIKPTPHFKTRPSVVTERAAKHGWLSRWPRLEIRV